MSILIPYDLFQTNNMTLYEDNVKCIYLAITIDISKRLLLIGQRIHANYKSLNKDKMNKEKVISIINCVKYKIIIFYVFTFLLFLFYWYVISAFCAVYVNTQRIFITNSVLSFCLGLLCPFAIYTIPTGLRFLSLSAKKRKNLKILYILSNIIPFF